MPKGEDLVTQLSHAPDEVCLLPRRMAELGLSPVELARTKPELLRELLASCTLCASHGRCADDLGDDFTDPVAVDWRAYCPNADKLDALGALRKRTTE
jgi:hypothetical protein